MSILPASIEALGQSAITRRPRQGRSLASFDRMLAATKELMLERGSEDFTLQDVSKHGNVSIGSIYLRFESKDRLLHAVIAQELQAIVESEREMVASVVRDTGNLREFLKLYVERYTAFLAEHALLLRAIMMRASIDPAVSQPGKETAYKSARMAVDGILQFADEIRSDEREDKAAAATQIIFSSVARQFGLGSTAESADPAIKELMASELAKAAYAYLAFSD